MKVGLKIYYSDILSSGKDSKMVLELNDGFRIIMARNTKIKLTPRFVQNDGVVKTWIHLIGGKLRAFIREDREGQAETHFRTRTVAMGVRGTDFYISSKDKLTKMITIDGEVAVRKIQAVEALAYENAAQAHIENKTEVLKRHVRQLSQMDKGPTLIVRRGEKIEIAEKPSLEERRKLEETLGLEEANEAIFRANKLKLRPASNRDLMELKDIGKDIKNFHQDSQKAKETFEELLGESKPSTPSEVSEYQRKFFLKLGIGMNDIFTPNQPDLNGDGLATELEYRPFPFLYLALSAMVGEWGKPNGNTVLNDTYYHASAAGGLRYDLTDFISTGAHLRLITPRQIVYAASVSSITKVAFDNIFLYGIDFNYKMTRNLDFYISWSYGSLKGSVESRDTGFLSKSSMEYEQYYSTAGLSVRL